MGSTSSQATQTHDIAHFFSGKGEKGSQRYCKLCKYVFQILCFFCCTHFFFFTRAIHDALPDPRTWPTGHNYMFMSSTSNGPFRNHLEHFHKEEYLQLCDKHSWTIQLLALKAELQAIAACKAANAHIAPHIPFSPDTVTN